MGAVPSKSSLLLWSFKSNTHSLKYTDVAAEDSYLRRVFPAVVQQSSKWVKTPLEKPQKFTTDKEVTRRARSRVVFTKPHCGIRGYHGPGWPVAARDFSSGREWLNIFVFFRLLWGVDMDFGDWFFMCLGVGGVVIEDGLEWFVVLFGSVFKMVYLFGIW